MHFAIGDPLGCWHIGGDVVAEDVRVSKFFEKSNGDLLNIRFCQSRFHFAGSKILVMALSDSSSSPEMSLGRRESLVLRTKSSSSDCLLI